MMDTFPAPDLFHSHTEKREFSATKFEIGKPCRRFNRMLQSSPRPKLVQSQGGRSLTPSHPKIYLFQSSSRMWNNGYTSQLLLDSSSLPVRLQARMINQRKTYYVLHYHGNSPWQLTMATHPKLSNSLCRSMTSEGSMGTASRNYIMRQERFAASVRAAALVHWYKPSLSYKPPCTRYTTPAPRT